MENENAVVAVTGRGMISSLGADVVTSCAAARAGLAGCTELDLSLISPVSGEAEPVRGHPAGDLTRGFEGFARLLRLTHLGLADLLQQTPGGPWLSPRTCAYLSMPDPRRSHSGVDLIADEKTRAARAREASAILAKPAPDIAPRLLGTAARLAGWPVDLPLRFSTTQGHTGVAECLERAIGDLTTGKVEAAIVGGVDSLLDEETLVWLESRGRLKRHGVPVGLLPGEACAFLLLETLRVARARQSPVFGTLRALCLGREEGTHLAGAPAQGKGLTGVLRGIAGPAGFDRPVSPWLLHDLNGETYRATEWGHALVRLAAQLPAFASPISWAPALSFGDVGAASGAVAPCLALHALARGSAPSSTAVVVSCSDGPQRAAVVLGAPPSQGSKRP